MLTVPMELGDRLGDRFEIEQRLSSGGMGHVLRGRDLVSSRPVAIKIMADTRDHAARFAREVEMLAELSHPGIVRYLSHGATLSGQPFLVMEWLDGEDLRTYLEHASLTMNEAVTLATRVAEALGIAHARGIVHRDLKPSNLFLPGGRVEQAKILDFGIAYKRGRTHLTQTGTMIGTPGYMAPEQARTHGVIDARADVFALGCVLFQCLTGTPAFEGDSVASVLAKILFGETPRVRSLWSEVPEDLNALVAQMLSKEPLQRPADGASLAAALAALGPLVRGTAKAPSARGERPAALTGSERRLVSVILVGSAGATDEATAEAVERASAPCGGRVEQLADGSTIVVLDSAHQVATDKAAQAARCALAMRAVTVNQPMAIATGRVDSSTRLPGGNVIDRASELISHTAWAPALPASAAAPPIALDEVSAGLLDARFDVIENQAGQLMLHGERILMQGARTLLGRPTSCVGRDWEIGALTGIFKECIEEHEARLVLVTAAAGMGKSRLGAELVSRVLQHGSPVAIWVGRGDSLRAGSTLDLLAQALRGALGIQGGEPLEARRDKLRARVAEHVLATEQKRVSEFLGELVGAPFPGDGPAGAALRAARQDAQLMSEQMRKAWLDFLHAEASVRPVLLVLEDLHWGDFGTVRFIDTALREHNELPWMTLALARPEVYEVFPRLWADRQNVQEIRLKELGRKAGERLVRQVLGDSVGSETIERLVKQSDGNAFYLEELIRAAAEGKDSELPETVLAMVETRLDRLSIDARRVLRAASVFGEVCWEGGVSFLLTAAMGTTMVSEWLTRLVDQEVLAVRAKSRFPEEQELAFRHALIREGAHATLTEEDRGLGHRLAGEWLEQHGEADPMVLAGHFERGGQGARAARYYLRASEHAFHVLDLDAAMARAGLGLGCDPPPDLRIDLLGMRCEASTQGMHLLSETMADSEQLMRLAPRGSIPWAKAVNAFYAGTLLAGRMAELPASIAQLMEVEPFPDAVGKMALALVNGIYILDFLGQLQDGSALEHRLFSIVQSTASSEPLARFWWNTLVGLRAPYAHDDPWSALQHSDAIQDIYDVIGGEQLFLNMQLFRGLNLAYLGQLAAAERFLREIVAVDEALGVASSLRRFGLSWLWADRGQLDEARALATELSEYGRLHQFPLEESRGRWALAEVLRRMGDLDGAERALEPALGLIVALERPGVLGTLSALRLAQGRADDALAAAAQAVAHCDAMGGCGMFRGAFVRLAHAEARARLFTTAAGITDPTYRRSFLGNVPENARTLELAHAWLGDATDARRGTS